MPMEDWIPHWAVARFLYDWQTLIAGVLAILAALLTIRATVRSADREIEASQAQTAVAQKQIETTLRLERKRAASESYAFHATIWAAMERVLLEASEAQIIFLKLTASERATKGAYEARRHFSKGLFPELRSACVRYGGRTARDLLEVESEIDKFASQTEEGEQFASGRFAQLGLHAGFEQQLDLIRAKAEYLHGKADAGMKANAALAETDAEPPTPTPT